MALASALPYAQPGAALYATVPAGTLLPVVIAAMQRGGVSYRHSLVWVKQALVLGRADYHYRHEHILYGWIENGPHYFIDDRSQDSVFEIDRPIDSPLHPTTKPVELIARMIANSSRPDELVFDPFCGSGSTVVAAHQLGRVAYGCEIDPGYLAVERLIGSIRRESLDHLIVFDETQLRRVLKKLRLLLQSDSNASLTGQECAGFSAPAEARSHRSNTNPRWTPSPIRQGLGFD
jgi:DNA methylase